MRVQRNALAVFAGILLLVLLNGCAGPRQTGEGLAGEAAPTPKVLDADRAQLDLVDEGLKVLWRQNLGQVAEGVKLKQIYLAGNVFIAETPDGNLFYFDATTGIWNATTRIKGTLWCDPVEDEGEIYAVTSRGLLVIDADSGLLKKQLPPGVPVSAPPVPFYGSLLLGGGNGKIARFLLDDGGHEWVVSAAGPVYEAPIVEGGWLYAAGYKGRVTAVDIRTGIPQWGWEPTRPSEVISGVTLHEGFLYVGDNRGFLYSLLAREGVVMWRYPTGAPIPRSPIVVKGNLLVFTYKNDTLMLRIGDEPKLKWRFAGAEGLLATGRKSLYLRTRDDAVACVDAESGKENWRLPLADGTLTVSRPSEPTFYVALPGGQIMAITEMD